ncbi:glycosyltransferase family 2 protein [Phocaeicola plebeius]|jgi:glycosyltransferase involved in cell wall biosynthesis|uniref:glycosyltransferase family 2 protein n=1 Tax=Phocaeicola plebeius TaxID=310297 RepID=UPI003AF5A5BD
MKEPKISIIIPVHNTEQYLQRCIDSIVSQNFDYYEILLIDDGSTDCSGNICDEYTTNYEQINVIHQQNAGALAARYTGFKHAKAQFLIFVDADDWLLPNALSTLYKEITNGYDIIKTPPQRISNNGLQKWIEHYPIEDREITCKEEYLECLFNDKLSPYLHSGIYKKELFADTDFLQIINSKLAIGEDWVLNVLISKKVKRIKCIPTPTYVYYWNNESVMTTTVRSPRYPEIVEQALGTFLDEAPLNIQECFQYKKIISYIMGCFKPEIPFSNERYLKAKNFLNKGRHFKEIKKRIQKKYLVGINHPTFFRIYTWIYRILYFNCILKRHPRKLYPQL